MLNRNIIKNNIMRNTNTSDDLYRIIRDEGIDLIPYSMPHTGSVSAKYGTHYVIGIDHRFLGCAAEERSHLAHEIGHCVTDSFYFVRESLCGRQKHEYRADQWAVHHLIPWTSLHDAMREGDREPWKIADRFCVSEEFVRRALDLYEREGYLPIRYEE